MNGNDKLILEVAFEIASALISNGLKEERFMNLSEDERAEAIVRSVVMGSLTTLEFFTEIFGEELVNDIMGELEELSEELAEELKKSGFEVTQATISRDIKILKLLKVQSISGKYRYVAPTKEERNINDKLFSILANSAISVEKVDKFVVVKTLTGAASAAAEAIDSLYSEDIAGTIAGDNTIFILIRTDEKALELITKIRKIIL